MSVEYVPKESRQFAMTIGGWTWPNALDYLYEHAYAQGDRLVLNIGCYEGRSCSILALACPKLYCVDMFQPTQSTREVDPVSTADKWFGNMQRVGVRDRIKMFVMPSGEALDLFRDAGTRFGFIFIDGGHEYEVVSNDLKIACSLILPGGEIVADDYIGNHPGVKKAVDEIGGFELIAGTEMVSRKF